MKKTAEEFLFGSVFDDDDDILAALDALPSIPCEDDTTTSHRLDGTGNHQDLDVELEPMDDLSDLVNDPMFINCGVHTNSGGGGDDIEDVEVPEVVVSNVVCQGSVCCQLDLMHCSKRLKNSEYNRSSFPALFVRLRQPAVTLLIFTNGKLLATGGKTYEEDVQAMRRLVKCLHKIGYSDAKLGPVSVKNLVAKMNLDFSIQLSKLVEDPLHKRYCQSQAGKFPCVNYKIKTLKPNVTVRIFGNGAIGFQSADSLQLLHQAAKLMMPVFYQFRLPQYDPVDPRTLLAHTDHLPQLVADK